MAVQTERRRPTKEQRRVVVTGTGSVTAVGHDLDVFYTNLPDG
jgi:3-oxoacyl-[acyl-carrier-protein] synthase II